VDAHRNSPQPPDDPPPVNDVYGGAWPGPSAPTTLPRPSHSRRHSFYYVPDDEPGPSQEQQGADRPHRRRHNSQPARPRASDAAVQTVTTQGTQTVSSRAVQTIGGRVRSPLPARWTQPRDREEAAGQPGTSQRRHRGPQEVHYHHTAYWVEAVRETAEGTHRHCVVQHSIDGRVRQTFKFRERVMADETGLWSYV
jgi:hypothetical protein